MSCYTPASTTRSRSPSPAESSTALLPTQEIKELIDLTGLSSVHSLAKQSPQLSNYEWFGPFADFIHQSVAGTPTIHSDTINGLFQYFETPIDTYEQLCQLSSVVTNLKCACYDCHSQAPSCLARAGLMRACGTVEQDQKQARELLSLVFSTFREAFSTATRLCSVRALDVACKIYIATGRADTAMTVLECLIPLIEKDPELVKERLHLRSKSTPAFSYNIGLYDEAKLKMMNKPFSMRSLKYIISFFDCTEESIASILTEPAEGYRNPWPSTCRISESLISLVCMVRPCHARTDSQYQIHEQLEAYDPCLTEAARWEEVE